MGYMYTLKALVSHSWKCKAAVSKQMEECHSKEVTSHTLLCVRYKVYEVLVYIHFKGCQDIKLL